jgi:NTE family protein
MTQRRLINWGYALCDAGIRSWVEDDLPPPQDFPYPLEGV